MFTAITTILTLLAIGLSHFYPVVAWSILTLLILAFFFMLLSLKRVKHPEIDHLSNEANGLIKKYGHYYARPFGGSDCSGSCSFISLGTIVTATISCISGDWWSLAIAVPIYIASAFLAKAFNPTKFLSPLDEAYHDEVMSWLSSKSKENIG